MKTWFGRLSTRINAKTLSVLVFSLILAWIVSFAYEGQVLRSFLDQFSVADGGLFVGTVVANLMGLVLFGMVIKTLAQAKRYVIISAVFGGICTAVFLSPPSFVWAAALHLCSFLAGGCVAVWGHFFKSLVAPGARLSAAADVLIYSNIAMVAINAAASYLSPYAGLALDVAVLLGALFFILALPAHSKAAIPSKKQGIPVGKILPLLCLFIAVISVCSGLMYHVVVPAYGDIGWLSGWYWDIPYIGGIFLMKILSDKFRRPTFLYTAILVTGFAFLFFMILDRSWMSYLLVDTLMLGACGVFDLFWWSTLGDMLDDCKNPAACWSMGLSANLIGVLVGALIGDYLLGGRLPGRNSSIIAFIVVYATLALLPVLSGYLNKLSGKKARRRRSFVYSPDEEDGILSSSDVLTSRENQIALRLAQGRTYHEISEEMSLSTNTVKTHVRNIYTKLNIQNRTELVNVLIKK